MQSLNNLHYIPLGPSSETPCRFTNGSFSVCLASILFHAYLLLGESKFKQNVNIKFVAAVIAPWAVSRACLAFSRSAWKPSFIKSSVTLGASTAPLASGLVSWAFARASSVASLAFLSAFFLRLDVVPALVLLSRASPASADSVAFSASS